MSLQEVIEKHEKNQDGLSRQTVKWLKQLQAIQEIVKETKEK